MDQRQPVAARRRLILSVVVILALVISPFLIFGERFEAMAERAVAAPASAPTIAALCAALLALDILLPVPSSVVATAAGAALGFWAGAACIWIGLTIGCFAGYLLGAGAARSGALRPADREMIERAAGRYGVGAVVLFRAVPVLAEASVIHAGLSGAPLQRFAWASCLANAGVAAGYAAVGAYARSTSSFLWAVVGSLLVPAFFIGLTRLASRRRASAVASAPERIPGA